MTIAMPPSAANSTTGSSESRHVLDRSGLASLSDLKTKTWHDRFSQLDEVQREFLRLESQFRGADYKWPRDALRWWSRCWEYPFAIHHLDRWRKSITDRRPIVADLGSGVTFFPFAVAKLDCDVVCLDNDPICVNGMARAADVLQIDSVKAALVNSSTLPLEDGSLDALYCISVLEHIPNFENTILEIQRVLRPNGLLILTVDLDLTNTTQLSVGDFDRLREFLALKCYEETPERTVHPADILYSNGGPYPMTEVYPAWYPLWFELKQRVKPLIGRPAVRLTRTNLAVHGSIWRRRA